MTQLSLNKKIILCVFAHPDDESFGPGGTICKLAKDNDVYLICATRGEAGGNAKDIASIRSEELEKSAKILGVKEIFYLDFVDGELSNSQYSAIVKKIQEIVDKLKPEVLITFEPNGLSGHIDHIVVSSVTSYVFTRSKFVKKLMYYCFKDNISDQLRDDYFVFFPPGYKPSEITETIDITNEWDAKLKAMAAHDSQKDDAERVLKVMKNSPKEECFLSIEQ